MPKRSKPADPEKGAPLKKAPAKEASNSTLQGVQSGPQTKIMDRRTYMRRVRNERLGFFDGNDDEVEESYVEAPSHRHSLRVDVKLNFQPDESLQPLQRFVSHAHSLLGWSHLPLLVRRDVQVPGARVRCWAIDGFLSPTECAELIKVRSARGPCAWAHAQGPLRRRMRAGERAVWVRGRRVGVRSCLP